ncbi:ligand-gated channel protein [Marinomonas pollencensis]|uniref:Outer membrane receptor for ferrienterochelin and colicins n=1 Tax=Marinomonas pollencensis TaxID=491954 RepID=A0A3E0DTY9_9GAMM|nr:ligand-gated channel protein [Marinomonas pollencensis]REG84948.1 outer membrane receptor for ferrienterochelin and colicins [Marinomonas pollencensis]
MTSSPRNFKRTLLAAFISAASYSPVLLAADDSALNDTDVAKTLDQLVVTASGHAQQVTDAPASITVVTQEELESKPYKDVTDALQDVPGVMVTGGGSSQDISMRGMSGKYTLILVDGKRQGSRETRPNGDNSGIEQGWTPPLSAIDHIEVVRGPMSSLYGSDALGGVINIITKKVQDKWGGEISASTTIQDNNKSGDSRQADLMVSGPLIKDKLGLQFYGQVSQRDEDDIYNGYADQDINNGTAKVTWKMSDDQDIIFEAGKETQDRDTHVGKSIDPSGRGAEDSDTEYTRDHYAVTHNITVGDVNAQTYITNEQIDNPSRDMYYEDTVVNNQTTVSFDSHILTFGGQYQYEKLDDSNNGANNGVDQLTRWQAALFVEDEYFLTDDLSLTSGLRYNKDENYGDNFSPRLYANWGFAPNWTLKGGVSSGYRSPDLREGTDGWGQDTGGSAGNALIIGNSDLDPEKSVSGEAGLYWDSNNGTQISGTIYRTDYKDKITEERICDTGAGDASCTYAGDSYTYLSQKYNVDRVVMQGIELTLNTHITKNVSFTGNYTYTDSEQKSGAFSGEPLNRLPKHMINATTNWTMSDKMKSWARVNYRGKSSDGLERTSISKGIPSYTFVDTGMSYALTKDITVYAGIYNILDKEVDYDTYEEVLDGRRYNAKIRMKF